jgi:hypothetical protein
VALGGDVDDLVSALNQVPAQPRIHTACKSALHVSIHEGVSLFVIKSNETNASRLVGTNGDHSAGHVLPGCMLAATASM